MPLELPCPARGSSSGYPTEAFSPAKFPVYIQQLRPFQPFITGLNHSSVFALPTLDIGPAIYNIRTVTF